MLAGSGTVDVRVGGKLVRTVAVSGVPKLYPLVSAAKARRQLLTLTVGTGVRPYAFTFG